MSDYEISTTNATTAEILQVLNRRTSTLGEALKAVHETLILISAKSRVPAKTFTIWNNALNNAYKNILEKDKK